MVRRDREVRGKEVGVSEEGWREGAITGRRFSQF